MKTKILGTLAAMFMAAGQAQAAYLPLQDATITASYNGQTAGMLGVEQGYVPGSNVSSIDPGGFPEPEFITTDGLFIVDFDSSGLLTVYRNNPVEPGNYTMRFDFGATLAVALSAFSLVDTSAIGGLPVLTLIDSHTIGLDLSAVQWNSDSATFSAQLDALAPAVVPEPASAALLLAGLAGIGIARRKRASGR